MALKSVVIIGGGFAGITCARALKKSNIDLDVTIIDQRLDSQFLPLLPDIIGRRMDSRNLSFNLDALAREGIKFILRKITNVDLRKHMVTAENGESFEYDYLVIAAGATPDFHGNTALEQYGHKFYEINDAIKILEALHDGKYLNIIVAGAGYTGIEVATAIKRYCDEKHLVKRVTLIESAPELFINFPPWMRGYIKENMALMNIPVLPGRKIEFIRDDIVSLSGAENYDKAFIIWAAGVKGAEIAISPDVKRTAQNRIPVGRYLQINANTFCCGDIAAFANGLTSIRMGVQFSIAQAKVCAKNIVRTIKGLELIEYKPIDLGFILPMANDRGCGTVLGIKLKGARAQLLHYFMCSFRSWVPENKTAVWRAMFRDA